jgi:hypothetical protein
MNPTLKDALGSAAFLSFAVAFFWTIIHFARRSHPFAAYRSVAPEDRKLHYEKLWFARLGDYRHYRSLWYAFRDQRVVFYTGWLFGTLRDYYAVPLHCLHIPRDAAPDVIASIPAGEVAMEIDKSFVSALKRQGVKSR